jgi:hypothetical protein
MTSEELSAEESAVIARLQPLLADPAVWDDPRVDLGNDVVRAVLAEPAAPSLTDLADDPSPVLEGRARRRWTAWAAGALVGAAAAALVAVAVTRNDTPSPDGEMAIVGTDLAPGVSGAGSYTQFHSGLEIEIRMPGLPRRDGGDYYELWMHNCDGSAWVPAGTFHDMEYVRGWAGVPAADYPVLQITRETAGGAEGTAQAPSGDVVAWGELASCPSA